MWHCSSRMEDKRLSVALLKSQSFEDLFAMFKQQKRRNSLIQCRIQEFWPLFSPHPKETVPLNSLTLLHRSGESPIEVFPKAVANFLFLVATLFSSS
ncbi:uncharacterized protein Gasu_31680 [Galdieria sulphuraria]|uniref:Uncharacterized protein n=1 Tax=Galdieria sulphuraria TaxID=130081 RepID=M2XH06_GALSU|nr:uncharacterized protein Gasu_31680 [Galdieria sulphuraria]EME29337.1 hypothetical protein Gasu_31680 [Galdieria sulphuraria]|eukprot:XP_005705857.1 hypothetical protein Gasu_31680 [Galdieria sulphuraria]